MSHFRTMRILIVIVVMVLSVAMIIQGNQDSHSRQTHKHIASVRGCQRGYVLVGRRCREVFGASTPWVIVSDIVLDEIAVSETFLPATAVKNDIWPFEVKFWRLSKWRKRQISKSRQIWQLSKWQMTKTSNCENMSSQIWQLSK